MERIYWPGNFPGNNPMEDAQEDSLPNTFLHIDSYRTLNCFLRRMVQYSSRII